MANKKYIGVDVLDVLTILPPPIPPSPADPTWTARTSWPFDGIGSTGRALSGCYSPARSRFLVLGFAWTTFGTPIGDMLGVCDDAGITWDSRSLPFDIDFNGHGFIDVSDSQDRILIVGPRDVGNTHTKTAYSDDGGDTWTENDVVLTGSSPDYFPFPSYGTSVKWIEEQSQWVLGCANLGTSPDGLSWTNRPLGSAFHTGGGQVYDIAYSPVDDRIAIASGSHILTSDDAGATWTQQSTPLDGGQIIFVKWCPSISKFIAGYNNSGSTRSIMFSDDGITWSEPIAITNDPGYKGDSTVYQTFNVLDIGPQIVATISPAITPPDSIPISEDGGISWTLSRNPGGGPNSFVLGDDVVLALCSGIPIMSSIIPIVP